MTELHINLPPEVLPDDSPAESSPTRSDALLESMMLALESPRGLAIDCSSYDAAVALRFKYYSARRRAQKRGNDHFDSLIMRVVKGSRTLLIMKPETVTTRVL